MICEESVTIGVWIIIPRAHSTLVMETRPFQLNNSLAVTDVFFKTVKFHCFFVKTCTFELKERLFTDFESVVAFGFTKILAQMSNTPLWNRNFNSNSIIWPRTGFPARIIDAITVIWFGIFSITGVNVHTDDLYCIYRTYTALSQWNKRAAIQEPK